MTDLQFFSYLYGFFGTDGTPKTWGENNSLKAITLEVSAIDKEDIIKISKLLQGTVTERERNTNVSKQYNSCTLYTSNKDMIKFFIDNNFPIIDKTNTMHKPTKNYDEDYFWLGIIDGDGSLGFKNTGHPYINLTTKSEQLKEDFLDYIEKYTGFRPNVHRNKRDNIYNITVGSQKAIILANQIYNNKEIYLGRKYNKFIEIKDWKQKSMKGVKKIPWTKEEELDVMTLTTEQFLEKYPNRTLVAIKGKKQKLKKEGII